MQKFINLIKKTNGDIIGIIYFIIIIYYILQKSEKYLIEYIILFGAFIGFLVDLIVTINIIYSN